MKLIISSEDAKIGAVFKRELSMKEILKLLSKVEVPDTDDPEVFEAKFKESVKKRLSVKK